MGLSQSKDHLLFQQVGCGNVEGIKQLRRDGAGLEWVDKEGKTPLILACMRPELLPVVKVLIDLGANVNAYRAGSHAGTPLHHAAKRGSVQTVELLLSHGANPLVMNDDCQTALDVARAKGQWNVVRLIETRICIFAGWMRETHGPSILEVIIRQWVSRKVWAVIIPCDSRNSPSRPKYELAVYSDLQASQPSPVISLWKVDVEEPSFNQADPALTLLDKATRKRYKFLAENEGDKQQLRVFYNACKGTPQQNVQPAAALTLMPTPASMPMPSVPQPNTHVTSTSGCVPQSTSEDDELAMAINASIQSAIAEGVPLPDAQPVVGPRNSSGWGTSSGNTTQNGWGKSDAAMTSKVSTVTPSYDPYSGWAVGETTRPAVMPSATHPEASHISVQEASSRTSDPSAPPLSDDTFYRAPLHYPSIDSSPVNIAMAAGRDGDSISFPINLTGSASDTKIMTAEGKQGSSNAGSCVICLDAPAEAACIPCGHVAGCMPCLTEIKEKKWGCPVCRAKIDQVIKVYTV